MRQMQLSTQLNIDYTQNHPLWVNLIISHKRFTQFNWNGVDQNCIHDFVCMLISLQPRHSDLFSGYCDSIRERSCRWVRVSSVPLNAFILTRHLESVSQIQRKLTEWNTCACAPHFTIYTHTQWVRAAPSNGLLSDWFHCIFVSWMDSVIHWMSIGSVEWSASARY